MFKEQSLSRSTKDVSLTQQNENNRAGLQLLLHKRILSTNCSYDSVGTSATSYSSTTDAQSEPQSAAPLHHTILDRECL